MPRLSPSSVRALAGLLVVGVAGAACEREPPEVRYQREIAELKLERQRTLDELYARYGQGELAEAVKTEATERGAAGADTAGGEGAAPGGEERGGVARELWKAVGNAAQELDRAAFDSHCETLGTGERPSVLSERGKAFFGEKSTEATCLKVAEQAARISALERELKQAKKAADD